MNNSKQTAKMFRANGRIVTVENGRRKVTDVEDVRIVAASLSEASRSLATFAKVPVNEAARLVKPA